MQVLFAVAEAEPFAKTGGLGDVGGSLPIAIKKLNVDIRVIMPQYCSIPPAFLEEMHTLTSFTVNLGWRNQYCGLKELIHQGVHYYFIDNEYYFKRDHVYGYSDDAERIAFFNKAVLDALLHMKDFHPDVIHCNDWHTALIPVLLKEYGESNPFYHGIKTILTIHNIQHQGIFPKEILGDLLSIGEESPCTQSLEHQGAVNYLKGGLLNTDFISTVSPTYAEEILDPCFGEGLDSILRQKKERLIGILNGIDYGKFNPQTDPGLVSHYPSPTWKQENKVQLQALLNLPEKEEVPIFAIVSRLVDQKGLDLLNLIMDELLHLEIQLVVLGTGEKKYEEMFLSFAAQYPEKIAVKILFDEELARKVYGGADLLLMPSRFEPCGLAQMMAMRYGTIPLVRETGGLKDSVIPYQQEHGVGNGFTFGPYQSDALLLTIQRAVELFYKDKKEWNHLVDRAMQVDYSWEKSARKYIDLYRDILA